MNSLENTLFQLKKLFIVIFYTCAYLVCRLYVWSKKIPLPPVSPVDAQQRKLLLKRFLALKPVVPVPEFESMMKRLSTSAKEYVLVLKDVPEMFKRKDAQFDQDFSAELMEKHSQLPEYYKRNFHHQTDGYLSAESAKRYNIQYELVFMGLGQLIRQTSASQLCRYYGRDAQLNALEIGSGTGQLGICVKMLFPNTEVVITDPSVDYINYASNRYPNLIPRGEPTFAEDLSFCETNSKDLLFSGFAHHEMPTAELQKSLKEAFRVLTKGGHILIADSCQDTNGEENRFALDQFELTFHEPYYKEFRAAKPSRRS